MGQLVNGEWHIKPIKTEEKDGQFRRKESSFRGWVKADGSTPHAPESGRYHLYVSYACPWAHRTLIFRKLKRLEGHISVSVVNPLMYEHGWPFEASFPDSTVDHINGKDFLYEVYIAADEAYTGRVTVPVLWDKKHNTIVNNESSEIIRMLNSEFDELGNSELDFYPEHLRGAIDEINEEVYHNVNNGVYKSGFARTQTAYEEAVTALFGTLDKLEGILGRQRYIAGDQITEADWRLFPTLARFDPVYVSHFKCNIRRIQDYPHLHNYFKELYQMPGVKETVNLHHIKEHYYRSHESVNPTRIVPQGPVLDWESGHDRGSRE